MLTTTLSTKGQIVIPEAVRRRNCWRPGLRFTIEESAEGVFLRAESTGNTLRDLVGIAQYTGPTRSLADMEAAIAKGAAESSDRD